MYVAYSVKGRFCTKHPYQQAIGELLLNKGGKYKLFLASSHVVLNSRQCIKLLFGTFSDI